MLVNKPIYQELQKLKAHEYCCFIYESEKEWRDSIIPFIIQGLVNGDKCIYVLDKRNINCIYQCLLAEGIDVAEVTSKGQLMVVDTNTIIADNPAPDIEQIINIFSTWLDIFLAEGYTAIRLSSEVHFGLYEYQPGGKLLDLFMRLKRDIFPRYPLIAIYQYHRLERTAILREAIITSNWILRSGHLYSNPSCIHPEIYFCEKNDDWEAEYWVGTQEALWKSEQKYRTQVDYLNTLINTMNEFCVTYDRDTKLTFVNHRLLEAMGYSSEEMLGKSILDFIHGENKASVWSQINHRLEKGEVSNHETTLLCKGGSKLLVKLKGSPIIENDIIVGALVLAEDISQQRKLEKDMARLGKLNTVGEIAASIGHEIRNPMTTVQGFLQLLSQNKDFVDYQVYFDLMLDELNRANSIISEFLALAKDKIVNLQKLNINKILETMAPLLMADALNGDKNIYFELKNVADLLLDEAEIRQLILNLVRNGLESMSSGGTISIKTAMLDDEVVLSVQDEGNGIPAEMLEKLGTPFLSTKENGTGLGLAVCYSIVARHHAKILVDSSSNGSTFNIHFTTRTLKQ